MFDLWRAILLSNSLSAWKMRTARVQKIGSTLLNLLMLGPISTETPDSIANSRSGNAHENWSIGGQMKQILNPLFDFSVTGGAVDNVSWRTAFFESVILDGECKMTIDAKATSTSHVVVNSGDADNEHSVVPGLVTSCWYYELERTASGNSRLLSFMILIRQLIIVTGWLV